MRRLAALGLAALAAAALATPARAHAALEASDPADGARLEQPPASLSLTFTEPPDPALSDVRVLDASGAPVRVPAPRRESGDVLRVPLPDGLGEGAYTVVWRVVSEVDSHLTAGAFSFGVGVDPADVALPEIEGATTPAPGPLAVIGRLLLYAGIAVPIGASVVGIRAFRGAVPGRRPLLVGAAGALLLGTLLAIVAEASTVNAGIVELLGTRAGRPYAWLAAVAVLAGAASIDAGLTTRRGGLVAAGVGAAAVALVRALGGHAAAASTPAFQVAAQWLHVLAVSTWIGGVALLAWRTRSSASDLAGDARRFSAIAVVAAPAAVVLGMLRASAELGGPGWFLRAFETSYGTTLAIKVALVAALLALGAWNRYRSIGRLATVGPGPLRRAVAAEVVIAVAALGITGTLTGFPPRPEPDAPASDRTSAVARAVDFGRTTEVVLRVEPGTPGPNRFVVQLRDPGSGEPVAADAVSLRLSPIGVTGIPAAGVDLERAGPRWTAEAAALSIAGTWEVRATIRRGAEAVEVPLALTTVGPPARIDVVRTPGQPTLTTATLEDGSSLQAFVDPPGPGPSQVHVTAFRADGTELPLEDASIVATEPGAATPGGLDPRRFGAGHFLANVELVPGRWRFAMTATTEEGRVLQLTVARTIGAG